MFFSSSAYADTGAAVTEGFNFLSIAPFVLIFVVMYFLLIRPQQKKAKLQQNMLKSLVKGDRIVTSGGIVGSVVRLVSDQELQVEISPGVSVTVLRSMVVNVLRGAPVSSSSSSSIETSSGGASKVTKLVPKKKEKASASKK